MNRPQESLIRKSTDTGKAVDSSERESRKLFVDFTTEDITLLKELAPLIRDHADEIVDGFYRNIEHYPELMDVIKDAGSNIDRLKSAQKKYLLELFDGDYGADYFERRYKIGVIHNQIGLTPRWYLGSYSVYLQLMIPIIARKNFKRKLVKYISALNKILSLDSQLAIDTYISSVMDDLKGVSVSKEDIEKRVTTYREFVESVATGDLSHRVPVTGEDELAQLGHNLNNMTEALAKMAVQVNEATSVMTTTLAEVQSAVTSQSAGASQQAASANETTVTLEEIKSTSQQTQEKAEALGQSAERTRAEGERGLASVEEAIEGMGVIRGKVEGIAENILELSEQTQQIGEITSTVNNLAQQLKMLALNASIEASKAGEAGKGFAVVAAEVRDLAEQSQQSTDQVHRILQDIQRATDKAVMVTEEGSKGVDEGVRLVEETGKIVNSLSKVISETALGSQQIVAAVRQEAAGIDQIATAMSDINASTKDFVISTGQTKKSADDLAKVAETLKNSSAVYRLK